MTYRITKTNGELVTELESEIIDNETISGVGLIGYMTPNYGETQSNNFIHIVENFANKKFPENPLEGQIVYRKTDEEVNGGDLYLCIKKSDTNVDTGPEWVKLPKVYVNDNKPSELFDTGDLWFNNTNKSLWVFDKTSGRWTKIGPNDSDDTYSSIIDIEMDNPNIPIIKTIQEFNIEESNYSYLIDLNIVCKEVTTRSDKKMNESKTSAWKYSMLVNCYLNNNNQIVCEIVDAPNYQLIGTNSSTHTVDIRIVDNNLIVEVNGNYSNGNKLVWKIQKNVLKVG